MSARKVRSGMKKKIIACLEKQGGGPLSIKKLNSLLGGGKEGRKEVQSALGALVKEGKVKFVTPKKVILAQPSVRVTGKFFLTPAGNGFVAVRGMGSDVFIPKSQTMGAFHNDVVEVEISGLRRGRTSGRVVRIVERGIRNVVGRLSSRRGRRYLSVEDKKLSHVFEVLPGGVRASEGDLVMAKIEEGRGRRLSVRLVENLGREDSVNSLTLSTLCVYGFDRDFPDDALAQAEKLPRKVLRDRKRVDLTGLPFVTIDGENARDFDDAICVFREGRGFRLLVSIADVSTYVPWDSPLDLEARRRGTSVYFPDRVVPMFPERLSNDLCSLREGVNRLTVTVDAHLDERGEVKKVSFYPSVIRSRKRLTYRQVQEFLDGKGKMPRGLGRMLRHAEELAGILNEKRVREGSLDFDLPESEIKISLSGRLESILTEERLFSHRIIEEFMLLANVCVARELERRGVPLLFRIHEQPDPLKLKEFITFASLFDPAVKRVRSLDRESLQWILDLIRGKDYEKILNLVMLRSFKLARYSPINVGHFGLAFDTYTHFTSPIRRYPDLVVHRILKHLLGAGEDEEVMRDVFESLDSLAEVLSERERTAEQAERDVVDKLKALFMKERIGEEFQGIVTSIQPFGLFVKIRDYPVEGLVPLWTLPGDSYVPDREGYSLRGAYTGDTITLGQSVKVRVENCDPSKGRIDFLLVEKEG